MNPISGVEGNTGEGEKDMLHIVTASAVSANTWQADYLFGAVRGALHAEFHQCSQQHSLHMLWGRPSHG